MLLDPAAGTARTLLTRNFQDRYNDPGEPVTTLNAAGRPVLLFGADGRSLFQSGAGARREGEFPFLDRVDLAERQGDPPVAGRRALLRGRRRGARQ